MHCITYGLSSAVLSTCAYKFMQGLSLAMISLSLLLALQHPPSRNGEKTYLLKMVCGCLCGEVIKNGHTRNPLSLTIWDANVNVQPHMVIIRIIRIMYIYHALINALSAHMIHINLNMILYTHVQHSPTKTIYIKYYTKKTTTAEHTATTTEYKYSWLHNPSTKQSIIFSDRN